MWSAAGACSTGLQRYVMNPSHAVSTESGANALPGGAAMIVRSKPAERGKRTGVPGCHTRDLACNDGHDRLVLLVYAPPTSQEPQGIAAQSP